MKADTHPEYVQAKVACSCGNTFTTRSTKPELHTELCNECHPFFTGKQKLVDTGGPRRAFRAPLRPAGCEVGRRALSVREVGRPCR